MTDLDKFPIVDECKQFINIIKDRLSDTTLDQKTDELKNNANQFFNIFSDPQIKDILDDDLGHFFNKLAKFIDSFKTNAQYIFGINDDSPGRNQIISTFINDLIEFFTILSNFTLFQSEILQKIKKMVTKNISKNKIQRVLAQFYLEISIFNFSYNIHQFDKPPYYQITSIPSYKYIHDQLHSTTQKFANVIGPKGSCKTKLIPLFLASRSLGYTIRSRFIILIENDVESIPEIEKTYNMINSNVKNLLTVTSSLSTFCEKSKDDVKNPVIIAILTPIDALKLIHKEFEITPKNVTFLKKTTFIIDDVNDRKVEADVFAQDILVNVFNLELVDEILKLVIIGTFSDTRFLNIFDWHCDTFEIPIETKDVIINPVTCRNYIEIGKISMLNEMTRFLDEWKKSDKIDVGSIITFVPNVKTGKSLHKHLIKIYQERESKIVLLQTKILRGESLQSLYKRLLDDIRKAKIEKSLDENEIGRDIIFLFPIDLTGYIIEEEKVFANSNLPLSFIESNFVRLIITTNKNEHMLKVPDVTVIFDSGITEAEYYDSKKFASSLQLEELPAPIIKQRNILLNKLKRRAHFIFKVGKQKQKKSTVPSVKRCNLDQSILLLRNIGIKFENQRNLPNEPLQKNVSSAIMKLKNIGFIDIKGELTELGSKTSAFSTVSPDLALATTKYEQNHEFAFLVSLIIEHSLDIIENSKTPFFCEHFCPESDVVTILESILELSMIDDEDKKAKSGISVNSLEFIYLMMARTFEKKDRNEGKEIVINSINWAKEKTGGILEMVDDYVALLDQDNYIQMRKATFSYISAVGAGSDPTIVYKANNVLKFDKDAEAFVKFSKRPGWNGLQAPGDIIVLSFQIEEDIQLNRGLLIHYDKTIEKEDKNIGIVSQVVEPFLNSCFFIALFEACWDNKNIENKLTPIYHSYKPKKETAFLIHINESNKKTFINYCPKTLQVQSEMSTTIDFLSSLMPFVPRSIVAKCDTPVCAVELLSYGTGQKYDTHVFLIDDPKLPKPLAYPVNKNSVTFANNNIQELGKMRPKIRFSITGESIYYKFDEKRQVEADFSYPNPDPAITSVFDPIQSSHLVLLVDNDYPEKPSNVDPIPWITETTEAETKEKENNELNLIIDVAAKLLSGLGTVERCNDVFFITLEGGFPTVSEGDIPVEIQNQVGFKDGEITGGIHELIHQFEQNFMKNNDLRKPIPLKTLGSSNHCEKYKKDDTKNDLISQINDELTKAFGYKGLAVDTVFIGNSMICINIFNLPSKMTIHPPPTSMFDDSYKPCQADGIINEVLNRLSVPVSTITHEPTVQITAQHFHRFRINQNEFKEKVEKISSKFGFLSYIVPDYRIGGHDIKSEMEGVIGEMEINLIGQSSCISCVTLILKEFYPFDINIGMTLSMTMNAMLAMPMMETLSKLDPNLGPIPEINPINSVIQVPQCEIEAIKDLIKGHNHWKLNEEYRVLTFPLDDGEEVRQRLRQVREENNIACFLACGMDEPELLPQCIYAKEEDGSVKTFGICKNCAISLIQNFEDVQAIYDPVTHLIDQESLADIKKPLPGLGLIEERKDEHGNLWPQIPIGQII